MGKEQKHNLIHGHHACPVHHIHGDHLQAPQVHYNWTSGKYESQHHFERSERGLRNLQITWIHDQTPSGGQGIHS